MSYHHKIFLHIGAFQAHLADSDLFLHHVLEVEAVKVIVIYFIFINDIYIIMDNAIKIIPRICNIGRG